MDQSRSSELTEERLPFRRSFCTCLIEPLTKTSLVVLSHNEADVNIVSAQAARQPPCDKTIVIGQRRDDFCKQIIAAFLMRVQGRFHKNLSRGGVIPLRGTSPAPTC